MNTIYPYCLSDQVIQVVSQQMNGTESSGLVASAHIIKESIVMKKEEFERVTGAESIHKII